MQFNPFTEEQEQEILAAARNAVIHNPMSPQDLIHGIDALGTLASEGVHILDLYKTFHDLRKRAISASIETIC